MGRPKVADSQRRRAAAACSHCRAAKKKCSASIPCTQCRRRGMAASCIMEGSHGTRSPQVAHSSSPSYKSLPVIASPTAHVHYPPTAVRSATHSAYHGGQTSELNEHQNLPTALREQTGTRRRTSSISQEPFPRPQMLLNLHREQVYIGEAASLSFLHLVREIVAEHIGPSQFSHNDQTENMLEIESPAELSTTILPLDVPLDFERMFLFSQIFESALDGLAGIFAPSEIRGLLLESSGTSARYRNPYKRATVDLVIAIGAQCESPKNAVEVGQKYFRHAQQLAFSETLEDPSVDMVRVFILMAFYMLGSCRRNASFMYIGVAARAAVTLGLHSRDSYTDMSFPKFQLRLRIWVSLCVLDMTVSALLGRPTATASLRSDLENGLEDMAATMQGSEMDLGVLLASYKILSIISDIVDKLYKRKAISGSFIEQYLDKIEEWKREYGSSVGASTTLDPAMPFTGGTIGNVHVSCLYYFAVTLVTRPILIPTLTGQPDNYGPTGLHMAQACVDAAIYLVQTCVEAQDAGFLFGNMCILKALVFIAGLILGLQSFCKQRIDYDVEKAFLGAKKNLEFLAAQSPQAAQYLDILNLLSTAIISQRGFLASAGSSRYVSRLFSLNESRAEVETDQLHALRLLPSTDVADNNPVQIAAESNSAPFDGEQLFTGFNVETSFNWDHFDITQWDDFLQSATNNQEIIINPSDVS